LKAVNKTGKTPVDETPAYFVLRLHSQKAAQTPRLESTKQMAALMVYMIIQKIHRSISMILADNADNLLLTLRVQYQCGELTARNTSGIDALGPSMDLETSFTVMTIYDHLRFRRLLV
jgi:hypothetical protein